jgi:hypothetical protein
MNKERIACGLVIALMISGKLTIFQMNSDMGLVAE